MFDLGLAPKFSQEATVDVAADGVVRALALPAKIAGLGTTYFVRLSLRDAKDALRSRNFYWLSTKDDELDWKNTKWFYTPTRSHADLTALAKLPPTTLTVSARPAPGPEAASLVTVENTGKALAFQVHLKMVDPTSGEERLPVFWEDNYFELFPGEKREIRVAHSSPSPSPLSVTASAWNAPGRDH